MLSINQNYLQNQMSALAATTFLMPIEKVKNLNAYKDLKHEFSQGNAIPSDGRKVAFTKLLNLKTLSKHSFSISDANLDKARNDTTKFVIDLAIKFSDLEVEKFKIKQGELSQNILSNVVNGLKNTISDVNERSGRDSKGNLLATYDTIFLKNLEGEGVLKFEAKQFLSNFLSIQKDREGQPILDYTSVCKALNGLVKTLEGKIEAGLNLNTENIKTRFSRY